MTPSEEADHTPKESEREDATAQTPEAHAEELGSGSELANLSGLFIASNVWDRKKTADLYADFARAPWYQMLNVELLNLVEVRPEDTIVDIGTGTGSLARLIALAQAGVIDPHDDASVAQYLQTSIKDLGEQFASKESPGGKVIAIDNAAAMLKKAEELSAPYSNIQYREGTADNFASLLDRDVTHVLSANAMHLFADPVEVLIAVWDQLPTGGTFAFSTAFSSEAVQFDKEESPNRWQSFLRRAMRFARLDTQSPPAKRESRVHGIDVERFISQMGTLGFRDIQHTTLFTKIPAESVLNFMALPGVGSAILPNTPKSERTTIFKKALGDETGYLPRNWAFIKGTKS